MVFHRQRQLGSVISHRSRTAYVNAWNSKPPEDKEEKKKHTHKKKKSNKVKKCLTPEAAFYKEHIKCKYTKAQLEKLLSTNSQFIIPSNQDKNIVFLDSRIETLGKTFTLLFYVDRDVEEIVKNIGYVVYWNHDNERRYDRVDAVRYKLLKKRKIMRITLSGKDKSAENATFLLKSNTKKIISNCYDPEFGVFRVRKAKGN